jgi:hypothetical protein
MSRRLALAVGALVTSWGVVFFAPGAAGRQQPPTPGQITEDQIAQAFEALARLLGLGEVAPEDLKRRVEEVGGLGFLRDVPVEFMTRERLGEYIRELFESEYPSELAEQEERVLRAFGFLRPNENLRTLRERVLNENIAGFYDERPGVKRLFAISSGSTLNLMNQLVLAHELRHSLQDQHFSLESSPAVKSDYDDRRLAALSLLEGDATLLMEKYLSAGLSGSGSFLGELSSLGGMSGMDSRALAEMFAGPELREAPAVVREQLVAPYLEGQRLAAAIFKRGGFKLLNEKLRSPPRSMEQVLHPEKYLDRLDEPAPVAEPIPAGGRAESSGRLGEFFVRVMLEGAISPEEASRAAAGWGGDAYALWLDETGSYRLAWRSVWDTEADAREFYQALARLAEARWGAGSSGPSLLTLRGADGSTTMARFSGREVILERAGFR